MFSSHRFTGKLLGGAIILTVFLTLTAPVLQAESEKALVEKAAIKIKLKKHEEAAIILAEARELYPASVEVAKLTVQLCEQTGAETTQIAQAYSHLTRLLKMKEVTEGSLSAQDRRLLKKTQKSLDKLIRVRKEVDAAVGEFAAPGIQVCKKLARRQMYIEASYIFQRLNALEIGAQDVQVKLKNLAQELKGNAALLKRPADDSGADPAKTQKLIRDAQRSFKKGDYNEARLACRAALEIDPAQAEARAILFDIARKTNDTAGVRTHGLTYLLFPPQKQSTRRSQEIEKQIRKMTPEMGALFDATARAADRICKVAKKASRQKKSSDVDYALEQLSRLTHRTKKVGSFLSKFESTSRGIQIFNGKSLSGWKSKPGMAQVRGGCLVLEEVAGQISSAVYTKMVTEGAFVFQFHLQLGPMNTRSAPGGLPPKPSILISIWGDAVFSMQSRAVAIAILIGAGQMSVNLIRPSRSSAGWETLVKSAFTGPNLEPGKWYKMRLEYQHKAAGPGTIYIYVNGKKAATISVPVNVSPKRTGLVGLKQQFFNTVKFKDIYLLP